MTPDIASSPTDGLASVLHASGPLGSRRDALSLFGRFVGTWHLDWSGITPAGEAASATGELHIGYVLGGRAVQDVWIVPGPGQPGEGEPPLAFHGTTIRFGWQVPGETSYARTIGAHDEQCIGTLPVGDERDELAGDLRLGVRRLLGPVGVIVGRAAPEQ